MASDKELSDFLKGAEKRAFKRVVYAVRDDDAAVERSDSGRKECEQADRERKPRATRVGEVQRCDEQRQQEKA